MLNWRRPERSDHGRIVAVVDEWWGGRQMVAMLPRLFVDHFADMSYVVEDDDGRLVGFVIAFLSPTDAQTVYVHFIGVDPALRISGLGRELYTRVAREAKAAGRSRIAAVTSPVNTTSLAFHAALGFEIGPVVPDYDGPGEDRVPLSRTLR
ncbi:MAG: GNAT family N-acetyltransferase [Candidatus Nanopelagicales bacterium]